MKNETARREIESLDYYLQNHTDDYSEESHTAMMMAIKALEQQPSEDCISRQKALDCFEQTNTRQGAKYAIETLPSVTPQTVTDFADRCKECGKIQNEFFNFDAPMVKKSDAVSREAVFHLYKTFWRCFVDEANADIFMNAIRDLPSVTPRRDLAETSQDCISRQAVIDFIIDNYGVGFNSLTNGIRDYLPPVTPKRPKGKWIEVEVRNVYATLKCSVCGRVIEPFFDFCKYSYEDIKRSYPYCHCGAEMEGEENV